MSQFKVVLDGFSLSADEEEALRVAVQRVVMDHIVTLDLGGDRSAAILPLRGNGSTQGIRAFAASAEQVQRAFGDTQTDS